LVDIKHYVETISYKLHRIVQVSASLRTIQCSTINRPGRKDTTV